MNKCYCEFCNDFVDYIVKDRPTKINNIEFIEKYCVCSKCDNEIYEEHIIDENIYKHSEMARIKNGIITINQIEQIMEKYNIGKKPLSLVLGFGEVTIIRYLDGVIPEKYYSDILLNVLNNVELMHNYLEKNKHLITNVAYKKALGKVMEIKLNEDKSKIYLVAKHIIAKTGDITPLSLQKLLYYIQGFSTYFLSKPIFDDVCEAWVHGPVYKKIYDRFSYYSYNSISNDEFNDYNEIDDNVLDSEEQKLVEEIINSFGCYSGKILEKMTHNQTPWMEARKGLKDNEPSNNQIDINKIQKYFKNISIENNIKNIEDINNYALSLFKECRG